MVSSIPLRDGKTRLLSLELVGCTVDLSATHLKDRYSQRFPSSQADATANDILEYFSEAGKLFTWPRIESHFPIPVRAYFRVDFLQPTPKFETIARGIWLGRGQHEDV